MRGPRWIGSWVTTTMVLPWAWSRSKSRMISSLVGAVEVAGRLVGQEDRRAVDEGPGDRHPLALAAGELVGTVVMRSASPTCVERLLGPLAAAPAAATPA